MSAIVLTIETKNQAKILPATLQSCERSPEIVHMIQLRQMKYCVTASCWAYVTIAYARDFRLNDLTLQQAVDPIKSSEQTQQQIKQMTGGDTLVHALNKSGNSDHAEDDKTRRPPRKECGNCGMFHGRDCPAYCGRMNHFAHRCQASSRGRRNRVATVHETADPKQDPYYIGSVAENKPQA